LAAPDSILAGESRHNRIAPTISSIEENLSMGFRFQKRIGIGSFGRVNISKSGVSLSEGVPGARVTIGRTPRITLGIPGSGLSWTQTFGTRGRRASRAAPPAVQPRSTAGVIVWLIIVVGALALLGWLGGSH
jgi:hypothetical protein